MNYESFVNSRTHLKNGFRAERGGFAGEPQAGGRGISGYFESEAKRRNPKSPLAEPEWIFGMGSKFSLIVILAVTVLFSFSSPYFSFSPGGIVDALAFTPKYWFDESFVVEAARGLAELGRLDIGIAPNTLSGKPYYTNSPGFTIAVPLAAVFSFFGFGIYQIRILAFLFLIGALIGIYYVLKKVYGAEDAFWGTLLVATFPPFYANGKTITGEVPGFLFLFLAMYAIYHKKRYVLGGILAGLALATKPSMYLLIVPAFFLEFLFFERPFWKPLLKTVAGALIPVFIWILIMFPSPFNGDAWRGALSIYTDHYPEPSVLSDFASKGLATLLHPTFVYIMLLLAVLFAGRFLEEAGGDAPGRFSNFALFFAPFAVFYFLLGPGWLRYLLVLDMFVLIFFYSSIKRCFPAAGGIVRGAVVFLVLLQSLVFFTDADIKSGKDSPEAAAYVNSLLEADCKFLSNCPVRVGFIDAIQVASLVSDAKKYQIVNCGGGCEVGIHPLSLPEAELPQYVVVGNRDRERILPYEDTLKSLYGAQPEERNGFLIYKRIRN